MQVECPHCRKKGRLADKYEGSKVRCPACSGKFIARVMVEKPLQWYFAEGREKKGPFTEREIMEKVKAGGLSGETLVWHRRLPRWLPAATVFRELAKESNEAVCSSCYKVKARAEMIAHGEGMLCDECKLALLQKQRDGNGEMEEIEMDFAGMGARIFAKVLDLLILTVLGVGVEMISRHFFPFHSQADLNTAFVITLLINMAIGLAYIAGLTGIYGATPGKMILGMKVVDAAGGRIGMGQAFVRYVGEFVVVPLTVMVGYLVAFFDSSRRTLYDRISDTRVVRV